MITCRTQLHGVRGQLLRMCNNGIGGVPGKDPRLHPESMCTYIIPIEQHTEQTTAVSRLSSKMKKYVSRREQLLFHIIKLSSAVVSFNYSQPYLQSCNTLSRR